MYEWIEDVGSEMALYDGWIIPGEDVGGLQRDVVQNERTDHTIHRTRTELL